MMTKVRWGENALPSTSAGRVIKCSVSEHSSCYDCARADRRGRCSCPLWTALPGIFVQDELSTLYNLACKMEALGLNQTRRLVQSVALSVGCPCTRAVSTQKAFPSSLCVCVRAREMKTSATNVFIDTAQMQVWQWDSNQMCWFKLIVVIWVTEWNKPWLVWTIRPRRTSTKRAAFWCALDQLFCGAGSSATH